MKKVIKIVFLWLVIINLFALLALNRFNLTSDTAYKWINANEFQQLKGWDVADMHARWDSYWYLDIVKNGYSFKGPSTLSNIVFFPIYPFIVFLLSGILLGNAVLAGWIASCAFLFLACVYLYKLIKEFHKEVDPELAVFFLLIFPTAFFLNAIYTESLFLFLSVAAIYYARRKNFVLAGILGFLAGLSRVTGALLIIPLLWEYYRDYKINGFKNPKFLTAFLPAVGTMSLLAYHFYKFKDLFLFFKVESSWGRNFSLNTDHLIFQDQSAITNFAIDVVFVLFALAMTYFVAKKIRMSYGLYMAGTLAVALSTGTLMSVGRYILVLFPIFIFAASIKNILLRQIWIFISILFLAYNIILFVNNYWAG